MKMKLFPFLFVAVMLCSGCMSRHNTIAISGTPGTAFTGTYTCWHFLGRTTTETVSGTVPKQFAIDSSHLNLAVHKETPGDMTVSLRSGASQAVCGTGHGQRGVQIRVRWYEMSLCAF
jgi:hypothetical protein